MLNKQRYQPNKGLVICLYLVLFSTGLTTSCTKAITDPMPVLSDSAYLINSFSIYLGGDSTNWNVSTRDTFSFDSSRNQLIETTSESTFGASDPYTFHTLYQYDNANKLTGISFDRGYYKSMNFLYNSNGNIEKGLFTDLYDGIIENEFTETTEEGNTVITQYDTLSSNLGKGQYVTSRPAIFRYTFNSAGKLINQYVICSELYNGQPPYHDTSEIQLIYDENNHLTQTVNHSTTTDNQNNAVVSVSTMQFTRDNTALTPLNDLALAVLRNLNWVTTCDYVTLFNGLYSTQYGQFSGEEPLKTTYEVFDDRNYSATYLNTYDARGLLTQSDITSAEHNIYNAGATTHETHYYSYLKNKK